MVNIMLQSFVDEHMNEPTVILSFKILLTNHRDFGINATMTKTEIEVEFNAVHELYGIATFRRDYVLRQCAHDDSAISQRADRFFIKSLFLDGMEKEDYNTLLGHIDNYWNGFQEQQRTIIKELDELIQNNTLEEQKHYISSMLLDRESTKRGQAFEVTSYAILSTYLLSMGFELNRFSTTYSNDGGIDFVAQNAVYQVTTKLSKRKFEEDIKKVPGKPRVLIYKDIVTGFDLENFNHELVINHIGKAELSEILDYLIQKNASKYVYQVLKTMKLEFMREFYQNNTLNPEH